jgi:hypothetical protein
LCNNFRTSSRIFYADTVKKPPFLGGLSDFSIIFQNFCYVVMYLSDHDLTNFDLDGGNGSNEKDLPILPLRNAAE